MGTNDTKRKKVIVLPSATADCNYPTGLSPYDRPSNKTRLGGVALNIYIYIYERGTIRYDMMISMVFM